MEAGAGRVRRRARAWDSARAAPSFLSVMARHTRVQNVQLSLQTMTLIILSASSLPRNHAQSEELRAYSPYYLRAYRLVLDAELHANGRDNLISARVAGYLLLELFNRRGVLSEGPCASLVKQLNSPSLTGGNAIQVVFEVGKLHHNHLLRLCGFNFFPALFGISVSSQFEQPPRSTQHPPHTLRAAPSTR